MSMYICIYIVSWIVVDIWVENRFVSDNDCKTNLTRDAKNKEKIVGCACSVGD